MPTHHEYWTNRLFQDDDDVLGVSLRRVTYEVREQVEEVILTLNLLCDEGCNREGKIINTFCAITSSLHSHDRCIYYDYYRRKDSFPIPRVT